MYKCIYIYTKRAISDNGEFKRHLPLFSKMFPLYVSVIKGHRYIYFDVQVSTKNIALEIIKNTKCKFKLKV